MILRKATSNDLQLLKYWDTKPHVLAAGGNDDWYDWPTELARQVDWQEFLVAEEGGRPIGIVQIIDPAKEESHYWGDVKANLRAIDIWIGEEADLGRGFGTKMMQLAFEKCFAGTDVTAILIDPLASNTTARRFYERLGFEKVENRTFDLDECVVYELTRDDWQNVK